jgi:hypothetical protein
MRNIKAVVCAVALLPLLASGQDVRFIKLEQDVRNLERTVQDLSRQLGDLKLQLSLSSATQPRQKIAPVTGPDWLRGENWARVRPGMSESEVAAILGSPTATRSEDAARVMLYATEVGPDAILAGRVTLRDGRVAEVMPPALR